MHDNLKRNHSGFLITAIIEFPLKFVDSLNDLFYVAKDLNTH